MKLRGVLIGVGAGVLTCVVGVVNFLHVREAWEHTTFHPDYELNGATSLVCLGLFIIVAFGIAGFVGSQRKKAEQ